MNSMNYTQRTKFEREYWGAATGDPLLRDNWICDKTLKDKQFITLLKPYLKGRTLEIGCGIGRLAELYDCGIDISPEMLKLAPKEKEYRLCDGRTIPYPDESFDSVFSVAVFQHLPNIQSYIDESLRVLKPGGTFIFQYIRGEGSDGPFSFKHSPKVNRSFKGIHPLWTWSVITK